MFSPFLPNNPFNSLVFLGVVACMNLSPLSLMAGDTPPSGKPWALTIETLVLMNPGSFYSSAAGQYPPFFEDETLGVGVTYDILLGGHELTAGMAAALGIHNGYGDDPHPPLAPGFGLFIRGNELVKWDLGAATSLTSSLGMCVAPSLFDNTSAAVGLCGSEDNGRTFNALIPGKAALPVSLDADLTLQLRGARFNVGVQANSNFLRRDSNRWGVNADYGIQPWFSAQWEFISGSTLGYSLYMQMYVLEVSEPDPGVYTAANQEDDYIRIGDSTYDHHEQFQTALFYRLHLNEVLPAGTQWPVEVHLSLGLETVHELSHLDGSFRWPFIVNEFQTQQAGPELETGSQRANMPQVSWPALFFRAAVKL